MPRGVMGTFWNDIGLGSAEFGAIARRPRDERGRIVAGHAMIVLQRARDERFVSGARRLDRVRGGQSARDRREVGGPVGPAPYARMLKLSAIDCAPIVVFTTTAISPLISASTMCGRPSLTLLMISHGIPASRIALRGPRVATNENPSRWRWRTAGITSALSPSLTLTNTVPDCGRWVLAASRPLWNAAPKSCATPITSPVLRISGPRIVSTPWNFTNGNTDTLTATWRGMTSRTRSSASEAPAATPRGDLRQRDARRLGHERDRPRGAGVDLEHEQVLAAQRELHVHQADDTQAQRERAGRRADLVEHRRGHVDRRQRAARVARVHPGLLDVLHDPGDDHVRCRR